MPHAEDTSRLRPGTGLVLDALRDGPQTIDAIKTATGIAKQTVRQILRQMEDRGWVRRVVVDENRTWELTTASPAQMP